MTKQKEEEKNIEEDSPLSEEAEDEIDDIDELLGDGGSKQYVSIQPSSEVSLMQKWLLDNENTEKHEEKNEKFTEYLSWQTHTAESTPEQQQIVQISTSSTMP